MQWISVIVAAAAGFAVGVVWYMVLRKQWMAAVGRSEEEIRAAPLPFVLAALASLLTAGLMRHAFVSSGVTGVGGALVSGFGIGLFFAAPWIVTAYAFAGRPRALWWIDGGHVVAACAAIGLVLGLLL